MDCSDVSGDCLLHESSDAGSERTSLFSRQSGRRILFWAKEDGRSIKMKKYLLLILLCGCSSFKTVQEDVNYEQGQPLRSITTKTTARTFFDSKSELSKFKASQTDKTQTTSVGSLSQESNGTNAVTMLEALAKIVSALPK